ncbi:MAG TPA: hypothetical protein VFO94_10860, partial [Gammaproteobacteria bacterium]|nr:hypothetical protein [Gammaproteobacteria bacterium]
MLRSLPACLLARLGAAALGLLPLCLAAQSDPALIDKLEKGDVMHVGDDNASRMDLVSVLMAASRPKCDAADPGFAKLASYIAYLGSDSVTGQYPSGEFLAIGVMGILGSNENTRADDQESNFDAPWMLNRNAAAMLEIGSHGCDDRRFRTVVANLFKTLDHHMTWHEQNLGTRAPLMKQNVVAMRAADWRAAVERDVDLPAQPAVTAQLTQLEARGASYLDCVYGPQNPDSTGSTQVDFWNKDVAIAGGDLQKLSRKHPLAKLGDVALTECPANLPEAQAKLGESRRVAQSKIDPSSLPP